VAGGQLVVRDLWIQVVQVVVTDIAGRPVKPSRQVSNGLVVHQMLAAPIVEGGVGQYANKVAKCLVLPAFSWQIRLVGTVVPNHE